MMLSSQIALAAFDRSENGRRDLRLRSLEALGIRRGYVEGHVHRPRGTGADPEPAIAVARQRHDGFGAAFTHEPHPGAKGKQGWTADDAALGKGNDRFRQPETAGEFSEQRAEGAALYISEQRAEGAAQWLKRRGQGLAT